MDKTLETIVVFVSGAKHMEIPEQVLERAREIFVDSLGCAFGGSGAPAVEAAKLFGTSSRGRADGCVIGSWERPPTDLAAFVNAAMIRYLDFNDAAGGGHPSDMIGALIAMVRTQPVTGRQFLRSIVVAYEVYLRIKDRIVDQPQHTLDQGFQAAIGCTAGLAYMLGFNEEQARNAISLAATSSVPLRASRAGELSHLKGFATALSLRDAVFYAHLAQQRVTAPQAPFEGRHGIVELLTGREGVFGIQPFDEWLTMKTLLKYWPVAYRAQMGVVAGLALRDVTTFEDIAAVHLRTSEFLFHESGSEPEKWRPQTRETADHSLPYAFSRSYIDGNLTVADYELDRIFDPQVTQLMQRVSVAPDEAIERQWPHSIAIAVDARLQSGRSLSLYLDVLPGFHTHPLSRDQIEQKFKSLAAPLHGEEGAREAFDLAWLIADCEDVAALMQSLVVPANT